MSQSGLELMSGVPFDNYRNPLGNTSNNLKPKKNKQVVNNMTVEERNRPVIDVIGQQAAGNVDLGASKFKPTEQKVQQDELFDDPEQYLMPEKPYEPAIQAPKAGQPTAPTPKDASTYDAATIGPIGTIDPATGRPTKSVTGQQGAITADFTAAQGQATTVDPITKRAVTSDEMVTAAKATPEQLSDINIQAATAEPSDLATTRGQLALLEKDFEGGKIPPYAAGPIRAANAQMLARGIGASSMAGQAILQAAMESSVQVAMQDAKAFQTFEMQNLSNKQQAAVLNAQMRATILGQELTNQQQSAVINASKFTEANNLNFTSEQTVALENSKMAQQMNLTNVSNKQAMAVQRAAAVSQLDMTNLNNRQQAEVQNAQAFLQMDMANLNNRQQSEVLEFQANNQRLFTQAASDNAARQFNATSENQVNQFYETLGATVLKQNADRKAAQEQFNVDQYNAQMRYNQKLADARSEFNVKARLQIDQSNIAWRRSINTQNNADQNNANKVNAAAILGLTTASQNNLWQQYRDESSWAYNTAENVDQRNFNLAMTILGQQFAADMFSAEVEAGSAAATGALVGDLIQSVFNKVLE